MGLTDYRQRETNTTDLVRHDKEKVTAYRQNEILTDYRHGPTLSIFVFRKKRPEEHFLFLLAYGERIVTRLGERILRFLGSLYDTFVIHSKSMKPEGVSLKRSTQNVTKIDNYVRGTATKVKERYKFSETSAMKRSPQGTVLQKTRVYVYLLMDVNAEFLDDILLKTLQTTQVENLQAREIYGSPVSIGF